MPRLFTGLELPAEIGFRLSLLRGGLPGARWVEPENYHITLRFIGDIEEPVAAEVADALGRIDRSAFELSLDGLGAFGNNRPHVVWAGVTPEAALTDLQAEQERMMQRLGLPPEGRRYTPHVTLARLKGASAHAVANWLSSRGNFQAGPFTASRFVLYSARVSKGGGPYLIEEAYPLVA